MNSTISDVQIGSRPHRPWLDGMAKRALCDALQEIQVGRLVIDDEGQVHAFGRIGQAVPPTGFITIHDRRAWRLFAVRGTIGAGEAYMLGYWSSPDLLNVIRVFCLNMRVLQRVDSDSSIGTKLINLGLKVLNANSLMGSKRNIAAHYDLGNDFFRLFLDQEMMYSAGIYPGQAATLDEAAAHKLELLCQKLQLTPQDHLLEIGTGWGGMAIYAARHYGCRVTTTTISRQQYEFARARVAEAGLAGQVDVLLQDYRELTGRYDKLVSIEMIEAVGHQYYERFFRCCDALLHDHGIMVIQAITIPDQRYDSARRSIDFIQKYIFPGGCLPSNAIIAQHVASATTMQISALEDITLHYARTLADWRDRFVQQAAEVRAQGFGEAFIRMWEFYLYYCEGGFRAGVISTAQYTLRKPLARVEYPSC